MSAFFRQALAPTAIFLGLAASVAVMLLLGYGLYRLVDLAH
jgi:predicted Na+-dependent transporter